jgi:hypothetical protein
LWVTVSLGSTLLVIGAVVAAVGLAGVFVAARRPLAWDPGTPAPTGSEQ